MREFFRALPPQSSCWPFVRGEGLDTLVERMCDGAEATTLIAARPVPDGGRPVGVASCLGRGATADVLLTLSAPVQDEGLAISLLEQLAALAVSSRFRWLQATVFEDNAALVEPFRSAGFEIRSRSDVGCVALRLDLSPSGIAALELRRRSATVQSLKPVLEPTSVAVVGPMHDGSETARRVFEALLAADFNGSVCAVDSATEAIAAHRCYDSVTDLPAAVDLAVVTVAAEAVPEVVDACGAAGIRALVVLSAGFAEAGDEGQRLQNLVVERCRAHGMRLVGPNCIGVLNTNPDVRLNASLVSALPPSGRIAAVGQSAALGRALLQLAADRALGFSTFVGLGNKADVSGNDLLVWAESDPQTSVILQYVESFGNPRRFSALTRRISRKKPIVVVKSRRGGTGSPAPPGDTPSSPSESAASALVQQSGVIRVETMNEMFDVAACLALQPLPPGRRIAIVTNAGGPGILAADACEAAQLTVVEFALATRSRLARRLLGHASVSNPLELGESAGPGEYRHAVEAVLTADETDALVIIHMPVERSQDEAVKQAIAAGVAAAREAGAHGKPTIVCSIAPSSTPKPVPAGDETLPAYAYPESGVHALGKAWAYAQWRAESPGLYWSFDEVHGDEARALCREVGALRGNTWLTHEELTRVLDPFGLPLVASGTATSAEEAVAVAAILGHPVVLKLDPGDRLATPCVAPTRLNLASDADVRRAYEELVALLPPASATDVLVQPMLTGIETFVRLIVDPVFGPLVGFGLRGDSNGSRGDVAYRMAPLTDRDADSLLSSVGGFPLLTGSSGGPAVDLAALRELLLRVSLIGQHVPDIVELMLSPAIALPMGHGCRVVSAWARIRKGRN